MGYGMKYTKGGFPFKTSPAKIDLTKKTGLGPRATDKPKRDEEKFVNEQDHQSVPTFTNSNPSPNDQALANVKSKNYKKYSDLEKNDDDRPVNLKPSFKPTPKGNEQRSKAENNLEKSEDEKGL